MSSGVLKGLKNQECERGGNAQCPPIAYVPIIDKVQDALSANSKEPCTEKIKLDNGATFQAGIWHSGTPEEFLNHVKQAVHACKRKGLFSDYAKVLKAGAKELKDYKKVIDNLKTTEGQ